MLTLIERHWLYQSISTEVPFGPNYASNISATIVELIDGSGKRLLEDGYGVEVEPIQILVNPLRDSFLITVVSRGRKPRGS